MKNLLPVSLLLSFHLFAAAQVLEVGQLNDILSEPSGIEAIYNPNTGQFDYWGNNDANHPEVIFSFRLDNLSDMTRDLNVTESYVDWEDMTTDEQGNIYLGDFGNFVTTEDLQVVKIPNPNSYSGSPPSVEIIEYQYPFAGVQDTEAFFYFENELYIWSKTVSSNANPDLNENHSYCFKIPSSPHPDGAVYTAELVDSFPVILPGDDPTKVKVTAADISPDKKKMVFLGYTRLWIFSCFEGSNFLDGEVTSIELPYRQYEGIGFINNHEVIITKEGKLDDPNFNPKVFYADLSPHIDTSCLECEKTINGNFSQNNMAWSKFEFENGSANLDYSNGEAVLDIQTLGSALWHISLRHKSLVLEKGKTYQLSFSAHADDPREISVVLNNAPGDAQYFYKLENIGTSSTQYNYEFTMSENTNFNSYLIFNVGRDIAHKVYFDDVSLVETSCQASAPTSIETLAINEVQVFPNPFQDHFTVSTDNDTEYEYQIFNSAGAKIKEGALASQMNLKGNGSGLYLLVLTNKSNRQRSVAKIFKQ